MRSVGVMIDLVVALIIVLGFAIRFYSFQTYLAHQLAAYMSEELNAHVSIDGLEIDLVKRVEIKGLFIRDLKGDTLLYAPNVKCLMGNYSVRKRFVTLNEVSLVQPRIRLAKYKGEKDLNFQFIADYFDDGKKPTGKKSAPWRFNVLKVKVERASFSMDNYNKPHDVFGVDFDHLGLKKLNVHLSSFHNHGDTSAFLVRNLSFNERSGFVVDTLNTRIKITPASITLTPLNLRTPYTELNSPYLSFEYSDFDDFDNFEEKVVLNTYLARTRLFLGDLAYFVHELKGSRQELFLNGKFKGTIDDFATENLTVAYSPRTQIRGDFKVKDITHIDRAYFDLDIKKLEIDGNELRLFQVPPYDGESFIGIPAEVQRMGDIDYTGTFKGTLSDFALRGSLRSTAGNAEADIAYRKTVGKRNQHTINGRVVTEELDLGLILDETIIGKITGEFNALVSSTTSLESELKKRYKAIPKHMEPGAEFSRNMQVKIDSKVQSIGFNGYAYKNTTVEGTIRNNTFTGKVAIRDENAQIFYSGYFNYGKKIPEYNFKASVYNAALTTLNFGNRDESATLSFKINTNGKGLKVDDLRGTINVTDINFCEYGKEYAFEDMKLDAEELADNSKRITFTSEVADLNIEGNFSFAELGVVFKSILSKAVPAMFDNQVVEVDSREVFTYKIKVKDFSKIQKLFIPELELSKNISIDGRFDSDQNIFRLTGKNIALARYGERAFTDLRIVTKNNEDYLTTEITAGSFVINDSIRLEQFNATVDAFNNDFASSIVWNNLSGNFGSLALTGSIESHNRFNIVLDTSSVRVEQGLWKTTKRAFIEIDSTNISIRDFYAMSGNQVIAIDGEISKDPQKEITARISNFRLETLTPIFLEANLEFKGDLNGYVTASHIYETPAFKNHVEIDSFFVNREWVGDVVADNTYENGSDTIVTRAVVKRKNIPSLDITGRYYLNRKENSLDYSINFDDSNLRFLNGFLPDDVVTNFQSLATGSIKVTGTPEEPHFNGRLDLHNGSIRITMLNTSYFLEDGEIVITDDMIALNKLTVMDVRGNGGKLYGTYNHENFKNGNFDFSLDFNKMLCLNTTEDMNDLYYGKAYASGSLNMSGYNDNIQMEIHAKTEKNTRLTLPMYGVSDITLGNFVTFVNAGDTTTEKKIDLSGITLSFDLNVTPDAEINIVFDKLTGQQLKARGHGDIKMEITPLGDFVMNGDYEIENPSSYKLAMQSIVNKNFAVAKGGTIKWYGDPLNAEIDITAVYRLQASVYEIMPADIQSSYRKNMEVIVEIQLKNSLYRPDFVFDFNVPKGDENVKAAVASVKSTQEELFRQTMALLIVNKFLTPANAIGTSSGSGGAAANYTSELITNQLNSLLSQISKDFDIGVNYKPGDEISNREIALALSTQILNGRMNLSGNFGMSSAAASQSNQNTVIGDFNLEYLVTEDGNIRVRAFNESNSFDITKLQQAPYTQGVGISYQKEFNTLRDLVFLQRLLNIFRKPENDVKIERKTREQRRAEKAARKAANKEAREERDRLEQGIDPEDPDTSPAPVIQ